jgi:cytochrome c553
VPRYLKLSAAVVFSAFTGIACAGPPVVDNLVVKVMSTTADAQHGHILFLKHCTGCHGARAWGNGIKEVPALAGQRELYLIVQLAQFATLERESSAMHEAVSPPDVDHAQAIRDLAAYLSKAAPNPQPEQGDGIGLAASARLFQRQCAICHGTAGQGSTDERIPALAGQHYPYTLLQLKNFAAGHRGQVEPPGIDFTAGLSAQEQNGIADYLSRLKPNGS